MPEFFVIYGLDDNEVRYRGQGRAADQVVPPGCAALDVPQAAIATSAVGMAAIHAARQAVVDAQAEVVRGQFITTGSGQALTYLYKGLEAKAFLADDTAPTPFLSAEAAARGMTVGDLAAEVAGQVDAWTRIGSRIEAARMEAKAKIANADTFTKIAALSPVDWGAAIAGPLPPTA